MKNFACIPFIPVFHTTLVYLRPKTILLETVKLNLRRYWLPSLRVKRILLELLPNGIGKMRSGRPGHSIVRLCIFTSGSLLSDSIIECRYLSFKTFRIFCFWVPTKNIWELKWVCRMANNLSCLVKHLEERKKYGS